MTTEAEAFASIVTWSTDLPTWQRDALRRLATQQNIEQADIEELAVICKGEQPGTPLEAGHLRDPNRDQGDVYLRSIHGVTHDLAFLFELQQAAHEANLQHIDVNSVARGADKAGFTHAEPPFKARKVEQIVTALSRQLQNERHHFDQGNEDAWRNSIKSIVGTLRDTWEIAVEQAVSHVIRRLSNKVDTGKLVKLTVITVADCETMRDSYGRCSELLHSSAHALNRGIPRPDAVDTEITVLRQWAADLKQRQDRATLP